MSNHQSRHDFCATAIATIFASATAAARLRRYDPARAIPDELGQTMPHSGSGFDLWRARPGRRGLFPDAERKGRRKRAQDQVLHYGRRLQRAEMRRGDAKAGGAGRGLALFVSLGTAPRTAVINTSTRKACRGFCSTPAHRNRTIRRITMDHGLPTISERHNTRQHVVSVKPNTKVRILYRTTTSAYFLGPFKQALADAGGNAKVIMEQT